MKFFFFTSPRFMRCLPDKANRQNGGEILFKWNDTRENITSAVQFLEKRFYDFISLFAENPSRVRGGTRAR